MAVNKLPFEKFKEIYSQVPRLVVEVLIKTPEGLILTQRAIEPYNSVQENHALQGVDELNSDMSSSLGKPRLTRRGGCHKGKWHLPGGTVMFQERAEDAVKRVAKEEVGLDVGIEKFLGYIEYPSEIKEGGFGWTVGLAFITFVQGGKITNDNQSSLVGVFKELPKNVIKEQFDFVHEKLGI